MKANKKYGPDDFLSIPATKEDEIYEDKRLI